MLREEFQKLQSIKNNNILKKYALEIITFITWHFQRNILYALITNSDLQKLSDAK